MPILLGNQLVNTVGDVNSRVRSLMNDDSAQLYPDNSTQLLNSVRDAYAWLFGQVQRLQGSHFEKVLSNITYSPTTSGEEQDLSPMLPVDIYFPISLEFRLNANETYLPIDRRQKLPSRNNETLVRPTEWEWRGQTIFINSSNQAGQLKITYRSLLTQVQLTSDPILIQNAVEAIAHFAAAELSRRRGQWQLMQSLLGDDGTKNGAIGYGAKFFAALVLDHIILNEQEVPRRGVAFSEAGVDNVGNRQSSQ